MSEPEKSGQETGGLSREEVLSGCFAQMVLQQVNMAMMLLGKMAHPQTGQTLRDLDAARMFIDQLEMIEAKTKGNLSQEEQALLKQSLMSLHLAFVEAVGSPAPSQPEPAPTTPPGPAESAAGDSTGEPVPGTPTAEPDAKKKFSKKY